MDEVEGQYKHKSEIDPDFMTNLDDRALTHKAQIIRKLVTAGSTKGTEHAKVHNF